MRALYFAVTLLAASAASGQTLVGFARLPADTFRDGPTSGQFIDGATPTHGVTPPFENKQPVQGISSVVAGDEAGTFLALSDNGFGTKANSADYLLCVYRVRPIFNNLAASAATQGKDPFGTVNWELAFHLSDPDGHVPWPIVAEGETYPDSDLPVPAEIREKRLLTGADFDPESMVRLPDGTFWIGDEFGPFLLHFDAKGRLLEPPVELPGEEMHSPDHPTKDPAKATIKRSGGFEGMSLNPLVPDGGMSISAMLEKSVEGETGLRFYELILAPGNAFRVPQPQYPLFGDRVGSYPLPAEAAAIGSFELMPNQGYPANYLVIERDGREGDAAEHKVLTAAPERLGNLKRKVLADLLNLADPHDLDGDGHDRFRFPFLTPESVLPVVGVDERTVLVVNDNNYPFTNGRPEQEGPDATEFILIRFDRPLAELGADVAN